MARITKHTVDISNFLNEVRVADEEKKRELELSLERKKENFQRALTQVLSENTCESGFTGLGKVDDTKYIMPNGCLTEGFREELRKIAEQELDLLDKNLKTNQPAHRDLFGVLRRHCELCHENCIGYEASNQLIPSSSLTEFPTFCMHCGCPAHFHGIVQEEKEFPEDFAGLLNGQNLMPQDLNFNSVLAVFLIKDNQKARQNLTEISTILVHSGIDTVSLQRRHLDLKEAVFLQSRIVNSTQKLMSTEPTPITRSSQIKHGTTNQLLLNKISEVNPYLVERMTRQQDRELLKAKDKKSSHLPQVAPPSFRSPQKQDRQGSKSPRASNPQGSPQVAQKQAVTENSVGHQLSPVREVAESVLSDEIERDIDPFDQAEKMSANQVVGLNRSSLLPSKKHWFMFGRTKPQSSQRKKHIVNQAARYESQLEYLIERMQTDPLLRELVENELLLVVLNSAQFQNLNEIIKNTFKASQLADGEIPLIYLSTSKVHGIEDCITFCPQLFRLNKSIIVSEPSNTFKNFVAQRTDSNFSVGPDRRQGQQLRKMISQMKLKVAQEFQHQTKSPERKLKVNPASLMRKDEFTKQMKCYSASAPLHESGISSNKSVEEEPAWLRRIRQKENEKKVYELYHRKPGAFKPNDAILFNFGVMQDFFLYSGLSVQHSLPQADLKHPAYPSGIRGGLDALLNFSRMQSQPCNIFQVAKVGLTNLILPNTLDVKMSNFENPESLFQISDMFFPQLGKEQHSFLVFRPLMVKNEINDLFVRILRLNDFLILKRKIKMLSKQEIAYLFKQEKVREGNAELYYNQMSQGPCEIVVVSKIGAVADANTILNGSGPMGRRRVNQLNEGEQLRMNVNAIDSIFEISPFSSFGELFDLEDFMIRNSNIKKFKALADFNKSALDAIKSAPEREKNAKQSKTASNLFKGKIQEIRHEINSLVRNFNLAGYASRSVLDAQQDIAVFAPSVGELEEVILILNPRYNHLVEDSFELLLRNNFSILAHSYFELDEQLVERLFREKYGDDYIECQKLYSYLEQSAVHIFHLTKVAADRECRERFLQSNLVLGDLIEDRSMSTPLQPPQIPFIFFFLDLESTFEAGLKLLYEPSLLQFTGSDLSNKFEKHEVIQILQTCLITTVGDKIKVIACDQKGNQQVLRIDEERAKQRDHFLPINTIEHPVTGSGLEKESEHLVLLQQSSLGETAPAIVYTVEAETGGLYDVKIHRLAHRGDTSKYFSCSHDSACSAREESLALFEQFSSLKYYYGEVNKISFNICPSFYKFRIHPIDQVLNQNADQLSRVFEVEEHMGGNYIEELAHMHYDHLKIIEHALLSATTHSGASQKSLPAYLQGQKLAQMCKRLEEVKCHSGESPLKGAGKIIYDPQICYLRGQMVKVTENSYYRFDRERYLGCLSNFRQGWDYYLSVLEIQIIEIKLMTILDSLTFKYSRQPKFLRVLPDRLTTQNLKISKKLQVLQGKLNSESTLNILKKFDVSNTKEGNVSAHVVSSLKSIVDKDIKQRISNELLKRGTTLEMETALQKNEESKLFSIVKECSISGFKAIGRRPKYQLAANILWLIDFAWRKLDRRSECFLGDRAASKQVLVQVEKEYDQILDIIKQSFCKNYGDDETNLALDVVHIKRTYETDFEKHMRMKTEENAKRLQAAQQLVDEERRKRRNCPEMQKNLNELIKTEVWDAIDEEQRKQREDLRRFLDLNAAQDADGAKFMKHLEESKIKFGPYALKVAEDYIRKQRYEQEVAQKAGVDAQERISLVKMEYFLFGVIEADLLIEQLKHMERRINRLMDEQDLLEETVRNQRIELQDALKKFKTQASVEIEQQLQSTQLSLAQKMHEVQEYRHQVSIKETELLLVFRELEACDFYVPEHVLEQQVNPSKGKKAEQYLVPMTNFWRPVLVDGETDPDLNQEKFLKTVNALPFLNEQNFGEFLAPSLRQSLLQTNQEKLKKLQKGGVQPGLRPAEKLQFPENIVFNKYESVAELKTEKLIDEQRKTLANRSAREQVEVSTTFKNYF